MNLLPFRKPVSPAVVTAALVPLDRALLCLDCDSIFAAEGAQLCPGCGSTTAWSVSRALNRPLTAAVRS
jgi:hypothetical protein